MAKDLFVSSLLDVYGQFLNEKQRTISEYYYFDDLSLAEIAEIENITRQGVLDYIKRAENRLVSLEKKCGYCEKFLLLKKLASNIDLNKEDNDEIKEIIEIINNL